MVFFYVTNSKKRRRKKSEILYFFINELNIDQFQFCRWILNKSILLEDNINYLLRLYIKT